MLKLKLQYFGHHSWRGNSFEKTMMLGKTEGRKTGRQRMRWMDGITNTMGMSLSRLLEVVMDRKVLHASQRVRHDWATSFTFHFHSLEKEMATHSSVLAWRIPGTGEPGGLPSMGSHRVGHDWSNLAAAAAAHPYMTTGKIIALTRQPSVFKVMSLLLICCLGWS